MTASFLISLLPLVFAAAVFYKILTYRSNDEARLRREIARLEHEAKVLGEHADDIEQNGLRGTGRRPISERGD